MASPSPSTTSPWAPAFPSLSPSWWTPAAASAPTSPTRSPPAASSSPPCSPGQTTAPSWSSSRALSYSSSNSPPTSTTLTHGLAYLTQSHDDIARPGRGGTLLFDAIVAVSHLELGNQIGRRAMVILTDGGDNGSHFSQKDAIREAQRADIMVYTVYYSNGGGDEGVLKDIPARPAAASSPSTPPAASRKSSPPSPATSASPTSWATVRPPPAPTNTTRSPSPPPSANPSPSRPATATSPPNKSFCPIGLSFPQGICFCSCFVILSDPELVEGESKVTPYPLCPISTFRPLSPSESYASAFVSEIGPGFRPGPPAPHQTWDFNPQGALAFVCSSLTTTHCFAVNTLDPPNSS